jgi:hypothetical protein
MPRSYMTKYQTNYNIMYSSDEMVQMLLRAEKTEMIGKNPGGVSFVDTFGRVQSGTCHPSKLAELRAEKRAKEIRARVIAEGGEDPLVQNASLMGQTQ